VLASLWGLERLARPHHVPQLAGLHHPLEHQLTATPGRGSARFEDDVITRSRLTERRILDWSDVRRLIDGCRLLPFLRGLRASSVGQPASPWPGDSRRRTAVRRLDSRVSAAQ
jgi:hypothetical protein